MPRKPSDITGSTKQIAVRVSAGHALAFKQLGGAQWLRKILADHLKSQHQKIHEPEKISQ
jgi:hypothetical protein